MANQYNRPKLEELARAYDAAKKNADEATEAKKTAADALIEYMNAHSVDAYSVPNLGTVRKIHTRRPSVSYNDLKRENKALAETLVRWSEYDSPRIYKK